MKRIEIDLEIHRAIENARLSFDETENAVLRRMLESTRGPHRGSAAPPSSAEEQRCLFDVDWKDDH